uniref:Uncharacterized protein n=1 Tax=Romanomermis culicivorax TaxID=13658 RepID=A0A915JCI3_ROMCU
MDYRSCVGSQLYHARDVRTIIQYNRNWRDRPHSLPSHRVNRKTSSPQDRTTRAKKKRFNNNNKSCNNNEKMHGGVPNINLHQVDNFDANATQVDVLHFLMPEIHHFLCYMRHLLVNGILVWWSALYLKNAHKHKKQQNATKMTTPMAKYINFFMFVSRKADLALKSKLEIFQYVEVE